MKNKIQKIIMATMAIMMFISIMLLSLERNENGKWEFATNRSMAQGGEDDGGGEEEDEEENGAKSIIVTETGSDILCVGNTVYKVVNFTVACIGVGKLPCTAGDWTSYEETETRCGATR